jgi:hypothetical protein
MKRDVVFVMEADAEQFANPRTEVRVQFDGPHPMGNAGMRVEIYEISLVRGGGDRLDTLHRLVHNQYINIPPKESLLTRVVNSCDKESAETIAYVLFHRYVIEPSLEAVEPHWLKTFAPHLWEWHAKEEFRQRESECSEVHES